MLGGGKHNLALTHQKVCNGESSVAERGIVAVGPSEHASRHRDDHTDVLVATVGDDVEPSEVRVHGKEVETEPDQQNLGKQPR